MIPPDKDAEFVAAMEDVLDVYHRSYDKNKPVICMDEQPIQIVKATREALPCEPSKPMRYDYEYKRMGTACAFMFSEPLAAKRHVYVRKTRTAIDWAQEMKHLLDYHYPEAEKVVIVMDNLNTHKISSFYKAFPPEEAKRLIDRLEIHHTPKHGSWLNIAEIELSVMTRQALDQFFEDIQALKKHIKSWVEIRNREASKVNWQFSTQDARNKLKRLYPIFSD